jgi:hypothetical protein
MREPAAVRALLAIAREKFAADLRTDVSAFDGPVWDVRSLRDRSTTQSNRRLYFTRHGTVDQPLPAIYGSVVKSWLILDRHSVANMSRRLDAARILWEAVHRRRKGSVEEFSWQNLSEEDLSQTELLMRASWKQSTTYRLITSMLVFTRFLAARGLCRPLYYTPQTARASKTSTATPLVASKSEEIDCPQRRHYTALLISTASTRENRRTVCERRRLRFLL